jgi:hypothetical protein
MLCLHGPGEEDHVELARICLEQEGKAKNKAVAAELSAWLTTTRGERAS